MITYALSSNPTPSEWEITDPRTATCEYCDQEAQGRILLELWGGHLWVCLTCWQTLRRMRSHPYSKAMDKFAQKACGYYANRQLARYGAAT